MKKIKVLSLFAGIGSFEKALSNIEINYELVGYSEISKHASKAYSAIHNVDEKLNLGDICKIKEKELCDFDLMTWGFPCTNFTKCRRDKLEKRQGLNNDESGLYFEGLRILKEKKPFISVIENVPDLVTDKFKEQFDIIKNDLYECGYVTLYSILSANDYNIPQSRKRLIIISIRNDIYDGFEFPKPISLDVKATDLLQSIDTIEDKFKKINDNIIEKIKTRKLKNPNLCPTITKAVGRAGSSSEYISNCAFVYNNTGDLRRMTPMETLLFQGFSKDDYYKIQNLVSDTQIYNFSANTIPVKMLEAIFKSLLIDFGYEDKIYGFKDIKILSNKDNQLYFSI